MTNQARVSNPIMLAVSLVVATLACAIPQQVAQQPLSPSQTPEPTLVVTPSPSLTSTSSPIPPTETATLTPTLTPIPQSFLMAEALEKLDVPAFDPLTWFYGVGLLEAPVPSTVNKSSAGSTFTFALVPGYDIRATLQYQNDIVAMWVQNGASVNKSDLVKAADTFAYQIYPKVREVFGEEWSPGVDNSPRIHVLNVSTLGPGVAGMYWQKDEYPEAIYSYSNQREMFYMSLLAFDVGSDDYMSTLAHEFQHMVQWNTDRNEAIWVNEGLSQVAERVTGYNNAWIHFNYLFDSRVQLNSWSEDFRESYSHYGAGYLYLLYLKERLGDGIVSEISHNPLDGMNAIEQILQAQSVDPDDMFADWLVANYVNDPSLEEGRYAYTTENMIPVCPRRRLAASQSQAPRNLLPQYSGNYVEIEGEGEFTINFKGDAEVRLVPASPKSGRWMWWSNNNDNSDATLTRAFDLTGLDKAMLQFWTWYDIQDTYDAGYVLISTDGGQKWEFLEGSSMVYNKDAGDYGPHYTGASGGARENPQWSREEIDLGHYIGKQVLIRFEYVTDVKYTGHGWVVDDIRIPQMNYQHDTEKPDDSWETKGFTRIDNAVPQKWVLYLVEYNDGTSVKRLELPPDNVLQTSVTLPPNGRATLIIGAMAPFTHVQAQYGLQVGGSGQMASLRYPSGVLFQDDFESPCSSFYSFILPEYTLGYREGKYEIEINLEDTMLWGNAGQELADVVVDVDTVQVKATKDSTTGLICRFQDDGNYYDLSIRNDGKFAIGLFVDGAYQYLLDWTASDAIKTGDGAENHLTATCNGNEIKLAVNGVFLGSVEDSRWRRGDIGFSAGTFDEKDAKISFDNLVVTRP